MKASTYIHNPILKPNSLNAWEAKATFNPSVIKHKGDYKMLYRAMSNTQKYQGKELELSSIGIAISYDKFNFTNRYPLIIPSEHFDLYGCEDPRVTKIGKKYLIFYTALSNFPPDKNNIKVAVAISQDLKSIKERHLVTTFNAKAMTLFPEKINNQFVAILTANTDIPPAKIAIAKFNKLEDIWSKDYWDDWYSKLEDYTLPVQKITSDQVEVGATPIETASGWLLIYSHIQNYYSSVNRIFGIEALLLDKTDPQKIIGRTLEPIMVPQEDYELHGFIPNVVFPSGAFLEDKTLYIYYGAADTSCAVATLPVNDLLFELKNNYVHKIVRLEKYSKNPILEPTARHKWESQAVFNPAAVYLDNKIHIVYRALSQDNTSVLGYASSKDGFHIDERLEEPIYVPRTDFETKKVENGNSGCEDPRITKIDNKLYMTYTAFNGQQPPMVALTSITIQDFLNKNWNFEEPIILSTKEIDNKNSCLFPEKINGLYYIIHRQGGKNIAIDSTDILNFKEDYKLQTAKVINPVEDSWDSQKIGMAAPPIRTEMGWLLLYHGVSKFDSQYRVGAMVLDIKNPAIVLSRTKFPILEPEAVFEKEGIVSNVVFPCGAVLINGILFVYYGGADKVVCVATIKIDDLLKSLY